MGAGLKKDLRVSRVGPGGSLNAFFFLLIGVISQRLAGCDDLLHGRGLWFKSRMARAAPGKRIEEASDYFMHAPLGSGGYSSVGRAPLLQLGRCDYGSSMDRTWTVVGVGGSPRVPSSEISGEEDQVGPCEQLDALSPFNPLSEMRQKKRKENPWTDPSSPPRRNYEITPRTPSASRGGGLPCGGCQRFESAYLQLVNLADTKLYDSTQFFRFGGSIYDLSFMDVDKIHPFSSTLGWHSLKSEGRGSNEERLTAKQPECCTLDGESPVAESITSLRSDPSSMGHVESRVNQQGPPCKAKYSWVTDSEVVPGEMPLEPRASWFSPKCVEAQQLTGHLGGSRSASETMGDKLHRREGNSPDHQLRPLNDRSVIKEVGVQRQPGGERSALERSLRASGGGRSGSENVGLSNANIGENPMPRKPKGSSARFVHGGVRRGRENASSQCSNTRRYGAEVTHAILPGKARTTLSKRVPVPETDTGTRQNSPVTSGEGVPPHKGGRSDQARATVYQKHREPATEAPVNGGRNYNGPKVAKFLVG
ncbi:hypothetical protein KY290_037995 [Solanum tuberosum]|uniref:Uncharacterized protein ycf68 n=4 Tax=Magnoliopsida TaxID=3398 RepID=A0ABQ7TXT2_SOLTU|nr:hypothetical protein KY290_037995 [Solanum tuberosum]